MNLYHLRYIVEIAKTQSINQAASNLYVSPQSISRALKSIETELDTQLFVRSYKGMTITESGKIFCDMCANILSDYEKTLSSIKEKDTGGNSTPSIKGTLTIYTTVFTANFCLNEFITYFNKLYPDVHVFMFHSDTVNNYKILSKKEDCLGILPVFDTINDYDTLSHTKFFNVKLSIFANDKHPLANRQKVSVEELINKQTKMLFMAFSAPENSDILYIFRNKNIDAMNYDVSSDYNFFLNAIRSGTHAGFFYSNRYRKKFIKELGLHTIDIDNSDINTLFPVSLIYNRHKKNFSLVEKTFIKTFKRYLHESFSDL